MMSFNCIYIKTFPISLDKEGNSYFGRYHLIITYDGKSMYVDYTVGEGNIYKRTDKSLNELRELERNFHKFKPDVRDVLYSLLLDANALDYPTYEEWADEYGYDPDSRKGEQVWHACRKIGFDLHSVFGSDAIGYMRESLQDY